MAGREGDPAIARLCERACAVVWAAGRREALCLGFGARGERLCSPWRVFQGVSIDGSRGVPRSLWWRRSPVGKKKNNVFWGGDCGILLF